MDNWSKCREVACRSCGAVFDLWCGDEARRNWRLWGLRYGGGCHACGFSATDDWCAPRDNAWRLDGLMSREFVVGGACVVIGAVVSVFLSWWGLAVIAVGVVALLRAAVSRRQS